MRELIRKLWTPPARKPTVARFLVVVGLMTGGSSAAAQQQLTEREVVELALERPELSNWWNGRVVEARAAAAPETAWEDPTLGVEREQVASGSTTYVTLEQEIPLGAGRRFLLEAAEREGEAAAAALEREKLQMIEAVRLRYWDLVERRRQVEAWTSWVARLDDALVTMQKRVAAGESAPFEVERLEREIADARTSLARLQTEIQAIGARMAEELGVDAAALTGVSGELLPEAEATKLQPNVPDLARLKAESAAAGLALKAASLWWVPQLSVVGGYINESLATQAEHGFVAGVGVSIPLFDHRRAARAHAEATVVRSEAERSVIERAVAARAAELTVRSQALRQLAVDYRADAVPRAERILSIAEAAFGADEIGIVEYLDSYRGVIETQLRAIELAAEARRARVELESTLGIEP